MVCPSIELYSKQSFTQSSSSLSSWHKGIGPSNSVHNSPLLSDASAQLWWGVWLVVFWLQAADLRRVAAAAGLNIADIHMAILNPASPPIGVYRRLFQDQGPDMCVADSASQFNACCLIAAWWILVISRRHLHHRFPPLSISHVSLLWSYTLSLKRDPRPWPRDTAPQTRSTVRGLITHEVRRRRRTPRDLLAAIGYLARIHHRNTSRPSGT